MEETSYCLFLPNKGEMLCNQLGFGGSEDSVYLYFLEGSYPAILTLRDVSRSLQGRATNKIAWDLEGFNENNVSEKIQQRFFDRVT